MVNTVISISFLAQMDLCGPNGKCVNTQQGYKCECDPGWILDTSLGSRDRKNSGYIKKSLYKLFNQK